MIGRIVRSEDFELVLRRPPRSRSTHFSLHHAVQASTVITHPTDPVKLSTGCASHVDEAVDDLAPGIRLGLVVPKRHAKRSVTRNLLRRQMRHVAERHRASLVPGLWVLRLRAPFPRSDFPSAASEALRDASRTELEVLFAGLASRHGHPDRRV